MSNQNTVGRMKKCATCGRKIPTSGKRQSSIEFRRRVNNIDSLDKLNSSKNYLALFVKSRFHLKECVDRFLEELEDQIMLTDIDSDRIYNIRIWILNYADADASNKKLLAHEYLLSGDPETPIYKFLRSNYPNINYLLGTDPETPLYNFLRSNYPDINVTFQEFYDNYAQSTDNPLNKNYVSRALSALGLKSVMQKIGHDKKKCAMVLHVPKEELSEIFRKNFGY